MMRRRVTIVSLIVLVGCFGPSAAAMASSTASDGFQASLNSRPLDDIDRNKPLRLEPDKELKVRVTVTNRSGRPIEVRSVRLDGSVLGLTFFTYTTRIDLRLEPGATDSRQFALDLSELGAEATGLLPAEMTLLGPNRVVLGKSGFPVEIKGSLRSAYGLFGVVVAIATALLLGAALFRLAMGLLPEHRWYRAVRFAIPGVGLGLTATFTVSALGLLVPSAATWVSLVVGGGLIGLVIGFLTPTPSHAIVLPQTEESGRSVDLEAPAVEDRAPRHVRSS